MLSLLILEDLGKKTICKMQNKDKIKLILSFNPQASRAYPTRPGKLTDLVLCTQTRNIRPNLDQIGLRGPLIRSHVW